MKNNEVKTPEVLLDLKLSEKQKRFLDKYDPSTDGTPYPAFSGKTDNGTKLDITGASRNTVVSDSVDEVIRVNSVFFNKSPEKQRKVLRLFMWWAIKSYFKTIFKDKPQFTKWKN
jgi:hypothetical protein